MKTDRHHILLSNKPAVLAAFLSMMLVSLLFTGMSYAQSCSICSLVDRLSSASIATVIRALSGEDSVSVDSGRELITTRYAFSPQVRVAMEYLGDMAESYGYLPEFRPFVLAVDRPELTSMTSSQGGDTVWVGSLEGTVFMSTDDGDWAGFGPVGEVDGRIFDLVTGYDGTLFAACRKVGSGLGSIHSSKDGGATWEIKADGSVGNFYQVNTISFWDDRFGVAAGHYGTFMNTGDGGESWWTAAGPEQFSYLTINGSAAAGPMHYWVACDGGYVFESLDFGNSWNGRQLTVYRLSDIDFYDPSRGVIVGDEVVFHTSDGGVNWTEVAHPATLESVTMIDSVNVLASGGGGDVWISGDGGSTWSSPGTGCIVTEAGRDLEVGDDGRVWTAGGSEILRIDPGWPSSAECDVYTLADTLFGRNIVFRRQGWKYPERKILLCGHYDSINRATDPMVCAPGADDNASGTSIVLECARVLSAASMEKTVEFALFDGEENGLVGSVAFAAELDTNETYEAVINIDMVGADYGGDGKIRLGAIQDTPDTLLVSELTASSDAYALTYPIDWYYRTGTDQPMSDDLSFKVRPDIPAVSLIESGYRDNPHYHNCSDLYEFLDMDYMLDVARIVLATAARMAGLGGGPAPDVVLHQNFPNPFFATTGIIFELPGRAHVNLTVYDVAGRRVRRLEHGVLEAGIYPGVWDGLNEAGQKVSSGVYFLRLDAGGVERSIKIVRMH